MLRGVSKRMIEVLVTDNEYFERAILIIKSEKAHVSNQELQSVGQSYVGGIHDKPKETKQSGGNVAVKQRVKNYTKWLLPVGRLLIAAAIGALVTYLLFV